MDDHKAKTAYGAGWWMTAAIAALGLVAVLASALPTVADNATGPAVLIAPPWVDRDAVIKAAGAHVVGPPALLATTLVLGEAGEAARLRALAPVLLVDLNVLKALCGVT